ncbi:MAG: hypothetical protein JWO05_1031 [Gemmatimonadetes bacterium]|nr:hypothetical protein [Gemmatimonadota bacterium]
MCSLLTEVPGDCDRVKVMRAVLADLLLVAEREPRRAEDIARWLYQWSINGDLPDEHFGWQARVIDDTFELARQTIVSRDAAMDELLSFLRLQSRPTT